MTFGDVASARGSDAAADTAARWSAGAVKRVGSIKFAAPKRGVPDATGDGGENALAARREAPSTSISPRTGPRRRTSSSSTAPREGGGGVGRPGGERRWRPRVRGRARARRPRQAARASARWRKRRERRRCPRGALRRGAKRRRRRGRFVFARARVRAVRVDVPRGPDGPRARRRAARSRARPASNGSSGAWTTAGARRSSACTPRRASATARFSTSSSRSASRCSARRPAGRGFEKKRRRRRRDVTRRCRVTRGWWVRGGHGGEFREVPGRARGGARPARVRGPTRARARRTGRAGFTGLQRRAGADGDGRGTAARTGTASAGGVGAGGLRGGVQG